MTRAALALSVLAVIFTGCGGSSSRDVDSDAAPAAREVRPAVDEMAVFERSRTPNDALPSDVAKDARTLTQGTEGISEELLPGKLDLGESRLLLSDLGRKHYAFWAWPTSKGKVCIHISFVGGCVDTFSNLEGRVSLSFGEPSRGQSFIISGIAPDDVRGVDVVVEGAARPAIFGNNAFFYEHPEGESCVEAVIAHYVDGSSSAVRYAVPPYGEAKCVTGSQ